MCLSSLWIQSPSATSDHLFERVGSRVNLRLHHKKKKKKLKPHVLGIYENIFLIKINKNSDTKIR